MTELFCVTENWISLITLTALEIVLGLDNILFIILTASSLAPRLQTLAWRLGLGFACITRLLLLSAADTLAKFTHPILSIVSYSFSGRDLTLITGGAFLLIKGSYELWPLSSSQLSSQTASNTLTNSRQLWNVIFQIILLDLVFSLDSIVTAIAMAQHFSIMAMSIFLSISLMLLAGKTIHHWVKTYPRIKNLGLSFLCLIGVSLLLDGLHQPIARSYLYTAIGFAVFIEWTHWISDYREKKATQPVKQGNRQQ